MFICNKFTIFIYFFTRKISTNLHLFRGLLLMHCNISSNIFIFRKKIKVNKMAAGAAGGGTGKSDMDRIGLFSEMGYVSIGDKYPKVHIYFSKYI